MMGLIERAGLAALRCLDPEDAHRFALRALASGVVGGTGPVTSPRLEGKVFGLDFPNPIGIAAGFDKNADAVDAALKIGVGFVEIGAVTPRPQPGNPRPRLFRLPEDRAAINRFGFNNEGMEAVATRLVSRKSDGIVGVNLGANKDSEDRAADFAAVLRRFAGLVDYFTVNVSSPNTEKLRDLQGRDALDRLLAQCVEARDDAAPGAPVLVKIAPDLDAEEIGDIAAVSLARAVDGIVATNTTLSRDGLRAANAKEAGGLSGRPLFEKSTEVLRQLARRTEGKVTLVGVGGVETGAQAYAKIRAGARLVQFYTAMVYEGPGLGARIARELEELLERDGFSNVSEAVGADL